MNGLQRGTLTEMRINVIYMGQFKDEWVMGILAKKLTSDWSDTVAKWFKHLTVDQKVPGLNPTCCFTGKCFLYSSSPWESTKPLPERAWR